VTKTLGATNMSDVDLSGTGVFEKLFNWSILNRANGFYWSTKFVLTTVGGNYFDIKSTMNEKEGVYVPTISNCVFPSFNFATKVCNEKGQAFVDIRTPLVISKDLSFFPNSIITVSPGSSLVVQGNLDAGENAEVTIGSTTNIVGNVMLNGGKLTVEKGGILKLSSNYTINNNAHHIHKAGSFMRVKNIKSDGSNFVIYKRSVVDATNLDLTNSNLTVGVYSIL